METKNGKLTVTHFSGSISGCNGFRGDAAQLLTGSIRVSDPELRLDFRGLACDAQSVFESYCTAGSFDCYFPAVTAPDITSEDRHLISNGVTCSAEPDGPRPSP